jgi:hypothetical protein
MSPYSPSCLSPRERTKRTRSLSKPPTHASENNTKTFVRNRRSLFSSDDTFDSAIAPVIFSDD